MTKWEEMLAEGMRILGPAEAGMDVNSLTAPADAVHERNLAHLRAYVDARRAHGDCDLAPICTGPGYGLVIKRRDRMDNSYLGSVLQSAIAEMNELGQALDRQAETISHMHRDAAGLIGRAETAERKLAEMRIKLEQCEELAAEARVFTHTD